MRVRDGEVIVSKAEYHEFTGRKRSILGVGLRVKDGETDEAFAFLTPAQARTLAAKLCAVAYAQEAKGK